MNQKQKNSDFIQLYRDHVDEITKLAGDNRTAFKLLMFFIKNMDGSNALGVSNKTLQELLGCSKVTVCNAVKYLKENGWICVLKSGTSNVYIINPEVAWTSYDNQKEYCRFNSTVLLSSSENQEFLRNPNASNHFKTIDEGFIASVRAHREEADQIRGQFSIIDENMNVQEVV